MLANHPGLTGKLREAVEAWLLERHGHSARYKPGDRVEIVKPAATHQEHPATSHAGRHGEVTATRLHLRGRYDFRYDVRLDGDGKVLQDVAPNHVAPSARPAEAVLGEKERQAALKARLLLKFGPPKAARAEVNNHQGSATGLPAAKGDPLGRRARVVDATHLPANTFLAEGTVVWWNTWGEDKCLMDVKLDSGLVLRNLRPNEVRVR